MATDFWASSHYKRWLVDRATLRQARVEDLQYVDDPEHLDFLAIFVANLISKLGKKLQLRQRVIATATVFFRRFYAKNSYCETDPFLVIAACCYVAAKAEESPVHIKNVVSEARMLFSKYGVKSFPSDNSKLAEMEFYLVDDLECDLTVFHPYRTLITLCGKEGSSHMTEAEAGEVGAGIDDGPKYWGTGEGKLELQEGALQMAWFIINDTYRSELCLLYPPHLIAIAAIHLALVLHSSTRTTLQMQAASHAGANFHAGSHTQSLTATPPRRSSRSASGNHKKQPQDIVGFMAGLNVSMPLVATIAQEIISLYALWDRYREDHTADSARGSFAPTSFAGSKRAASGTVRSGSVASVGTTSSSATPSATDNRDEQALRADQTVTPMFLTHLLLRMREARFADMAHPPSGHPIAVNKMLERTQAAG
ncbi:cyclin-like protein [Laetiporus sulphureus 93-53]|uniref:Cyclin-like protein n=1 Tax=Laetiporus sulphureus 93-53 TaxID=1314785 RepID=A0A165IKY1_9APHY|nr:cyclin-like protein [Laetiporus sulphureus 93-53]KZT13223.1 cyclin-like protein [Laetiporus sulphureus 93-53]